MAFACTFILPGFFPGKINFIADEKRPVGQKVSIAGKNLLVRKKSEG